MRAEKKTRAQGPAVLCSRTNHAPGDQPVNLSEQKRPQLEMEEESTSGQGEEGVD